MIQNKLVLKKYGEIVPGFLSIILVFSIFLATDNILYKILSILFPLISIYKGITGTLIIDDFGIRKDGKYFFNKDENTITNYSDYVILWETLTSFSKEKFKIKLQSIDNEFIIDLTEYMIFTDNKLADSIKSFINLKTNNKF